MTLDFRGVTDNHGQPRTNIADMQCTDLQYVTPHHGQGRTATDMLIIQPDIHGQAGGYTPPLIGGGVLPLSVSHDFLLKEMRG